MQIDQTTLEDAKHYGRTEVIKEGFAQARKSLEAGEAVQIVRKYDNAPPDILEVINSDERLAELEANWLK